MTPTIIKPTIGRIVWFHPSEVTGEAGFALHGNGQPYAAIIAHVHGDRMLNLTVFDANGVPHSRTSVWLVQDGDAVPQCGYYCEWMPYQKGQAAKADAAEKTPSVEPAFRQRTQREELEYALMVGAAARVAESPESATSIANGIKDVLNALHPQPVLFNPHTGMPRDARDVASDPQAVMCVKPGEPLKAAAITLPVVDPGPDSLEREIQTKADATPRWAQGQAPRVTMDMVNAQIVGETYTVLPSGRVTVCELTLANGFTVRGESAVVFIENNVPQIGREIARENAVNQIWPLLGFRLRDKLAAD